MAEETGVTCTVSSKFYSTESQLTAEAI